MELERIFQIFHDGLRVNVYTHMAFFSIEKYTKSLVTKKDLRPHDFAKYWPELQYTEDPK